MSDQAVLWVCPVEKIANDPDASPVVGMRRLIGTSPTGDWATHSNEVAEYYSDGWHYSGAPAIGQEIYNRESQRRLAWNGSVWNIQHGKLVYASDVFPTIEDAITFAANAGGEFVLDDDWTPNASFEIPTGLRTFRFAGGRIILSDTFNVTFSGQVLKIESEVAFVYSSTGRVLGTVYASELYPENWGADPTGANDSAQAIMFAESFMQQMTRLETDLVFTGSSYKFTSQVVTTAVGTGHDIVPRWRACGRVNLEYAGIGSGNAARLLVGSNGSTGTPNRVVVDGFQFSGDTTTIAVEIRGLCGLYIDHCGFGSNAVGVRINNYASGSFSENNLVRYSAFSTSCATALHLTRVNGNASVHGCGLVHCGVGDVANSTTSQIIVDNNQFWYGGTLEGCVFHKYSSVPIISITSNVRQFVGGDFDIELHGGLTNIDLASGNNSIGLGGSVQTLGSVSLGKAFFYKRAQANGDSTLTYVGDIISGRTTLATGANPIQSVQGGSTSLIEVYIAGSGYECTGLIAVSRSGINGTLGKATVLALDRITDTPGYGDPTFGFNNSLTITMGGSYVAGACTCNHTQLEVGPQKNDPFLG